MLRVKRRLREEGEKERDCPPFAVSRWHGSGARKAVLTDQRMLGMYQPVASRPGGHSLSFLACPSFPWTRGVSRYIVVVVVYALIAGRGREGGRVGVEDRGGELMVGKTLLKC